MARHGSIEVVYGPPGTGKTTYLMQKMASCPCPVNKIGFFSFTRAAANVALERLGLRSSPTIRTIHSMAFSLADASKSQMLDEEKLAHLGRLTGYRFSGKEEWPDDGDNMLAVHTFARATMTSLEEAHSALKCDYPLHKVRLVSNTYDKWMRTMGYFDFNRILELAASSNGVDALGLQALFIDEAQDLSPLQWDLIHRFISVVPQVWIAGDDDQSLYAWAGSMRHGMRSFHDRASIKVLDRSWRLPRAVHARAEAIISKVHDRVPKVYSPKAEEGTVSLWNDLRYCPAPVAGEETLILYRNHSGREEMEAWLIENRVPYRAQGRLQGLFHSVLATAIRAWKMLQRGETVGMSPFKALCRVVAPRFRKDFEAREFAKHIHHPWQEIILIADPVKFGYLSEVDLFTKPCVTLSTIHASKGMEADRVVLSLGMGDRTFENFDDDEHRVFYVGATRARKKLDVIDGPNAYPFPRTA